MTDDDVVQIGVRYRRLIEDATRLRSDLATAIDALLSGEVDPSFGRELVAMRDKLEALL